MEKILGVSYLQNKTIHYFLSFSVAFPLMKAKSNHNSPNFSEAILLHYYPNELQHIIYIKHNIYTVLYYNLMENIPLCVITMTPIIFVAKFFDLLFQLIFQIFH